MHKKITSAVLSVILAASAFGSTAISASAADKTGNQITLNISDAGGQPVLNAKYMLAEYSTSGGSSMSATALGYFTFSGAIGYANSDGEWGLSGCYVFDDSNIIRTKKNKNKTIEKGKSYAVICVETNNNGYPIMKKVTTNKTDRNTSVKLIEPKWGDLNFDGKIDCSDVDIMKKAKNRHNTCKVPSNLPASWRRYYCNGSNRVSLKTYLSEQKLMAWDFYNRFDNSLTERKFFSVYFNGINPLGCYSYADVNGDHKVNDKDLNLISRYVSGKRTTLGKSKINLSLR